MLTLLVALLLLFADVVAGFMIGVIAVAVPFHTCPRSFVTLFLSTF